MGSAIRTFTAADPADASRTATVQKMILAEPSDGMPAKLSVECNVDVKKVGQDANGTISLCVMDNGEAMASLLMTSVIDGASCEAVMEDDFSQPPAMSIATETVQELQYVDEPVRQTVTAVELKPVAEPPTAVEAVGLIPFQEILVSKPATDFALCEPQEHDVADEQPTHEAEEFSVEKLILSLADDADRCPDSSVASLMVSPQLEVFEPTYPVSAAEDFTATAAAASSASHPAASCSLTVACNVRKQLRKVLEHRRPASISH